MRIKIFIYLISLPILLFAQESSDTSGNSGIIYGKDHAFILAAPSGWILDNSSGVSQGLHAVFYPIGGSWKHSNTIMYANTSSKKVKGNETLEKVIEFDVLNYEKRGAVVFKDSVITIDDRNKKAILKYFNDKNYGNLELVAYIDEELVVSLIVLSSRDEKEFFGSIPKFMELVDSYMFLTIDVK